MTPPEPRPAQEPPFPGAHPQVSGARRGAPVALDHLPERADRADPTDQAGAPPDPAADRRRTTLALGAPLSPLGRGWQIRLAVRAEAVTVSKQVVVRERVAVERRRVAGVARIEADVRREELRTSLEGDVELLDEDDAPTQPPQQKPHTQRRQGR